MKALVVVPDAVELQEVGDPSAKSGEVVVSVHSCGICGSDVHSVEFGTRKLGQILGHEFAGTVVEIGPDVSGWRVGDAVAVNPHGHCGHCDWCKRDVSVRCPNAPHLGLSEPGGYAEYVAVPAVQVAALPPGTTLEQGAHVEPLAVAVRAIREAQLSGGEDVLVFGAGPIGLRVIMAARALGAGRVIALEISPARAAAAGAVGADEVLDTREVDLAAFAEERGLRFAVALECAGVPPALDACAEAVAGGGTIVQVAMGRIPSPLLTARFVSKNLKLVSSTVFGPGDFVQALALITTGVLNMDPLVSERIPLAAAPEAFQRLRNPQDSVGILVQPGR
jgi:threonine dehydrogenase-like Zn-dependent dehydrogenase